MDERSQHKGWHSRGYLPHLDAPGEIQALTFRLADALPAKVVTGWKNELDRQTDARERGEKLRKMIARYEDTGYGDCLLRIPACAGALQEALTHFDGIRYHLLEWCVMPNHVHVLIRCESGFPLGGIVKSWKTFTARRINEATGKKGSVWARDYHDRFIRDLDHLADSRAYIRNNPVKAGLCKKPEDWPWSSAAWRKPDPRPDE